MTRTVLIIIVSTVIMLALCAFGLFMLMVIMNGFSESQATPYFVTYGLFSLFAVAGVGTLSGSLITRNLPAETKPKLWLIAAISVATPLLIAGCLLLARFIQIQFK